jgi:Carboxypeptidase regulatory-like domain/TonB dependent receptor-like, beta-barrel
MSRVSRRVLLTATILLMPIAASAQEAVMTGTVSDSTGGVLPGVTVTALLEATGNTFVAVTDERGAYRLPVRVGVYRITTELQGFTTVVRQGIQLLVGQTLVVNLEMAPSTIEETITVNAEAPLLKVDSSSLGGNIDPRQVQEMPVQGRDWGALLLLAPGSRTTSDNPNRINSRNSDRIREFQANIDGQQFQNTMGGGGQPTFSQEMIAEFQFISNRFDATQGRSSGLQVNLVTKSGTNRYTGSFRSNFRDDRFNAPDPVLDRVTAFQNQQYASTFGGPILRDRLHFFAYHEYEREPKEETWRTPYARFNVSLEGTSKKKIGGTRIDYQLSPQTRLMFRLNVAKTATPFGVGDTNHPAGTSRGWENADQAAVQLTNVISNRTLNELMVGHAGFLFGEENLTQWSNHWLAAGSPFGSITTGSPRITFTNFTIGGNAGAPRYRVQDLYQVRNSLTTSYDARGRHDVKIGGELFLHQHYTNNCTQCMGIIDARGGAAPANIETLLPDAFNADTWNLAAISPLVRRYTLGILKSRRDVIRIPGYAAWMQDDWHMNDKLTLNLGVRYDLLWNMFQNQEEFLPFMESGRPQNTTNIQPRLGFTYQWDTQTVVRGGIGKYYGEMVQTTYPSEAKTVAVVEVLNDGRPDFAANPFNGPAPTYEQALQRYCAAPEQAANFAAWRARGFTGNAPCLLRGNGELKQPPPYNINSSWQSSIGFQRQVGSVSAVEVDYIFTKSRDEGWQQQNSNIRFNPATGVNYPFSDRSLLPYPEFGVVAMTVQNGRSTYHALQTAFTKRMSNRWQASATYTLGGLWDALGRPLQGVPGTTPVLVDFELAPDLDGEYGLSTTDLRHRAVLSGIWEVGRGFQMSGTHYTAIGERAETIYGGDLRNLGSSSTFIQRLRPDGTIVARNSFTQPVRNRTNLRVQQRVPLPRQASLDLIAEAFNVFNSPNWTISTQENNALYGKRTAGQFRTMQLGFRVLF